MKKINETWFKNQVSLIFLVFLCIKLEQKKVQELVWVNCLTITKCVNFDYLHKCYVRRPKSIVGNETHKVFFFEIL